MISGKAKIAGIIGWPVTHSLSPKLHNYWLEKYAIDGAYVPLSIKPEDLAQAIKTLPKLGFVGVNLTVPHKEMVLAFLDEVDDVARVVGAVNTVVFEKNRLVGMNTDVLGFADNVKAHLSNRHKAVILGSGGAARAVVVALKQLGFGQIVISNRTQAKAQQLADLHAVHTAAWDEKEQVLGNADLLINTTALGMNGHEPLELSLENLPKTALVSDIVYTPLITPLLAQAHARGNSIVDGLGMLIHQAAPGFEAWFGIKPAIDSRVRELLIS